MNKQFEDWYENNYGKNADRSKVLSIGFRPHLEVFLKQKLCFQWGVYLEFFDSVEILVEVMKSKIRKKDNWFYSINVDAESDIFRVDSDKIEIRMKPTRTEAQKAAIKKAFEILETN